MATDRKNITIAIKCDVMYACMGFQLTFLYFILAHFKVQGQSHVYFNANIL